MAYRLLEEVDWQGLNGQRVTVEVSAGWITFELKDHTLVKIAKATRPGHRKVKVEANGQPAGVECPRIVSTDVNELICKISFPSPMRLA